MGSVFFVAMKNQLLFFFLLSTIISFSQEKRKLINGTIKFNSDFKGDVHIINKNTSIGTISNNSGWFEIPVMKGDSLFFSHINLKKKTILITEKNFLNGEIEIELEEKTYDLKEITFVKPKSMFEIYNEGKRYKGPKVNAITLGLPFTKSKVKKETAIVSINSGAVVSLDNLINSLNGNNRRKKQLLKLSNEDRVLAKIRKHFTDDFFVTDLKIRKENINPFLNYCVRKKIISLYKNEESIKLTTILITESKEFTQKIVTDSLVITKK